MWLSAPGGYAPPVKGAKAFKGGTRCGAPHRQNLIKKARQVKVIGVTWEEPEARLMVSFTELPWGMTGGELI